MKFRKIKPDVYIDAIKITEDNQFEIAEFIGISQDNLPIYYSVSKDEWVVKYSNGNISFVTEQYIKEYYEPNN